MTSMDSGMAMGDEKKIVRYPEIVENAINQCLQSENPLDDKDFDPVAFLNEKFPNEAAGDEIEKVLLDLNSQIQQSDKDILDSIKQQSLQSQASMNEMAEASESIKHLHQKIMDIQGKAAKAEEMFEDICHDIKKLDFAKRNLTYTITSLKRFHMLATAVEQLKLVVDTRQYRDAANLLLAVEELLVYFECHGNLPPIARLSEVFKKTRATLERQITKDFKSLPEVCADYSLMGSTSQYADSQNHKTTEKNEAGIYEPQTMMEGMYEDPAFVTASLARENANSFYASDAHTPESLAGACVAIDALGSLERRKLIDMICHVWLRPYESIFGPDREHGGLDSMDRRFVWIRKLINDNKERYKKIFPVEWNINRHLLHLFVNKTASHTKTELNKNKSPDNAKVTTLVWALRKTLDFENEMAEKFEAADVMLEDGVHNHDESNLWIDKPVRNRSGSFVDPMSAEGIRIRYLEKQNKPTQTPNNDISPAQSETEDILKKTQAQAVADANELRSVKGVISSVFEPFLFSYVKLEASKMKQDLDQVISEENIESEGPSRLKSSSQMFLLIQRSMSRCVQFTTGQAFFSLCMEFKKIIMGYSSFLKSKLPKAARPPTNSSILTACFVCNAAEYCNDTIPQLEELVKSKVHPKYAEKIDMEDLLTACSNTLTAAIESLVYSVLATAEPDLIMFSKINWSLFNEVGDQSKYVSTLSVSVRQYAPLIRGYMTQLIWYHKFCSMLAERFIKRYKAIIFGFRGVSEAASQQLLLDVSALRSTLVMLPSLGDISVDSDDTGLNNFDGNDIVVSAHVKYVTNEMDRLEVIVKLVGLSKSPELLVGSFKTLLQGGTTRTLQLVLLMKGMDRLEQDKMIKLALKAGVPSPAVPPSSESINKESSPKGLSSESSPTPSVTSSIGSVFSSSMGGMRETFAQASSSASGSTSLKGFGVSLANSYSRVLSKAKNNE